MSEFGKYLRHRIKSTWVLTAVLCLMGAVLAQIVVRVYTYPIFDEYGGVDKLRVYIDCLGVVTFVMGALSILLPITELSGRKNKRNTDLLCSLPVSGTKQGAAHYLNGVIQLFAVLTVMYGLVMYTVLSDAYVRTHIDMGCLWLGYPVILIESVAVYSIFMFLFNEANSVIDGALFMGAWSIMPGLVFLAAGEIFPNLSSRFMGIDMEDCMVFSGIANCGGFEKLATGQMNAENIKYFVRPIILWIVVGALCAGGYFFCFKRKRAEAVGDISHSYFGYKVLIPLGVFSMTAALSDNEAISLTLAALLAVICYMIYRRSFKIKPMDIGLSAAIIAFAALALAVR